MSNQTKKYKSGIPMSEESLKEWQKAFTDIEESIAGLYKEDKKAYNKSNNHKRRIQV